MLAFPEGFSAIQQLPNNAKQVPNKCNYNYNCSDWRLLDSDGSPFSPKDAFLKPAASRCLRKASSRIRRFPDLSERRSLEADGLRRKASVLSPMVFLLRNPQLVGSVFHLSQPRSKTTDFLDSREMPNFAVWPYWRSSLA